MRLIIIIELGGGRSVDSSGLRKPKLTCREVIAESNGEERDHREIPRLEQRPSLNVVEDDGGNERAKDEAAHHVDEQRNGGGEPGGDQRHSPLKLFKLLQEKVGCALHYVVEKRNADHCVANTENLKTIRSKAWVRDARNAHFSGVCRGKHIAIAERCDDSANEVVRIQKRPIVCTSVRDHGCPVHRARFNHLQQFPVSRICHFTFTYNPAH